MGVRIVRGMMTTTEIQMLEYTTQEIIARLRAKSTTGDACIDAAIAALHEEVKTFCRGFPVPGIA